MQNLIHQLISSPVNTTEASRPLSFLLLLPFTNPERGPSPTHTMLGILRLVTAAAPEQSVEYDNHDPFAFVYDDNKLPIQPGRNYEPDVVSVAWQSRCPPRAWELRRYYILSMNWKTTLTSEPLRGELPGRIPDQRAFLFAGVYTF